MVRVVDHLPVQSEIHAFGGSQRRLLAKVEGGGLAVGTVIEHESTTTDVAGRRVRDRQGKGGRTHLVSPQMAAAAAVEGHFVDVRSYR